ncbi:MAG TPA: SMC-Scp complex subunit ScpB [Polyangia bacterium]|jgi:segregation and condensation protein B|nr:SMC-Scp complex subunit ScpB [Polyangia bacterium]
MKRKKTDGVAEPQPQLDDVTPAIADGWDGPTRAGEAGEIADLAAESARLDAELAANVELAAATREAPGEADGTLDAEAGADASVEGTLTPEGEALAGLAGGQDVGEAPADGAGLADGALPADDLSAEFPEPLVDTAARLESIIESLLYAADRPLSVSDVKRLVNERDGKKVTAALEALRERHADTGIQLASLAGGWQFRTHPDNGPWVAKLVAGRPQRLSRAMLEALAIVAYRQPITRPEIDEIRGVDCGPVLKTLLDRGFVRIVGKKEDVGRPMLYGTTPDFLKTFSLKDLSELPTLREFHELSEQQMASVDARAPLPEAAAAVPAPSPFAPAAVELSPVNQEEEDDLLEELDGATLAAARASGPPPGTETSVDGGGFASGAPDASEAQR